MLVTATEVFRHQSGKIRGRVCRRPDDLWVFVIERFIEQVDELLPYWINDYRPSGLFRSREEATASLQAALGDVVPIEDVLPVTFNTDVGPYPEPAIQAVGWS